MSVKVTLSPRYALVTLKAVQALDPARLTPDERDALPRVEARIIRAMGKHGIRGSDYRKISQGVQALLRRPEVTATDTAVNMALDDAMQVTRGVLIEGAAGGDQ